MLTNERSRESRGLAVKEEVFERKEGLRPSSSADCVVGDSES